MHAHITPVLVPAPSSFVFPTSRSKREARGGSVRRTCWRRGAAPQGELHLHPAALRQVQLAAKAAAGIPVQRGSACLPLGAARGRGTCKDCARSLAGRTRFKVMHGKAGGGHGRLWRPTAGIDVVIQHCGTVQSRLS